MARKMGPDGPKLQIREKNGHYYAYTSTSRMVDGRKKTVNECLGRYDPETGTVIPKKPMKSREEYARIRQERDGSIDFSKIGSRSYGASHLLDSIQRRMSLGEDLQRSYAHKAKTIMACAMALAVNPGPFSSIADTLENTYLRDLYGTEMEMTPQNISEFTAALGEYDLSMDSFFESRLTRCNGLVAWDTAANRTYSDAGGMAEQASSTGGNGLNAAKKAMATDMRGIPLLFRFYPGSLSDLATVDRLLDDLKRYERTDAVFVMDSGFTSGSNIRGMIARGTHFVSPAKPDCKAVKTLLTDFRRASEKKALVYGGRAYTVWKTELGLKESGRPSADGAPAYDFTTAADADHGSEGLMAAYVCYDAEKHSDEIQNRELLIDSLTEYARNIWDL